MSTSKLKRFGFVGAAAGLAVFALSACSDGYSRGYSSMSVGVTSSSPGYYDNGRRHDRDRDGIPNRYDRDRDGDGVPNRFDDRPNNPYRD